MATNTTVSAQEGYGKYNLNNGVPTMLLGDAMGKQILQEAELMIKFTDFIEKLNAALTNASDELRQSMKNSLITTKFINICNIVLLAVSVAGVSALLVEPVEAAVTKMQQFQKFISGFGQKAQVIAMFSSTAPMAVSSYLNGVYQAITTQLEAKTELLKASVDTFFASFDVSSKTSNSYMLAIQELIKNAYNSSTLPLYYKNSK